MPARHENFITLKNGKKLAYAEYGDPTGKPLIYLHGCPGSRFEINNPKVIATAERLQARVILPERPGFGLSDPQVYTLASIPELVAELADQLGFDRFALAGNSSGSKYAAACAWKIPERLSAAVMICAIAPLDLPGIEGVLSEQDREFYAQALNAPAELEKNLEKLAAGARENPASVMTQFAALSEEDQTAMRDPDLRAAFGMTVAEAFRQGTQAVAFDWKLEASPWGFALSEIKMPLHIWHGATDRIISPDQARLIAREVPDARLRVFEDAGHMVYVDKFEELLREVVV